MKTETKKILKRLQEEANLYAPGSLRKELLLDAIKTIDALEIDNIAFGYVIQVLRRKSGLSNEGNSVDCQEIYVYIDKLQKQLQEEKQKQREYEFEKQERALAIEKRIRAVAGHK